MINIFYFIKVYLTSDSRYVSPEGQFLYNQPKTVDSTYIIRKPYTYANDYKPSINFENVKLQSHLKPQAYSNNHKQFLPIAPPLIKSGDSIIYKPIVTSLIFPSDGDLFDLSSLNTEHGWNVIYEPLNDYFVDNTALFNSHQVIYFTVLNIIIFIILSFGSTFYFMNYSECSVNYYFIFLTIC